MEIKKGDKFKCINNLYRGSDSIRIYSCGKTYISEVDGCITDDVGDINHSIASNMVASNFIKLTPTDATDKKEDRVSHPSHYTWLKEKCGVEVIDITRHFNFDIGNALKYLLRAGHKDEEGYTTKEKQIEDLKKAIFYINDELRQIEDGNKTTG